MAHIFRWDLDKTYLQTDFDSIRGLVTAALQSAEEKQNIPGTGALLRELQGRPGARNRIFVVSGSPRQMRRVLERKLLIDGVSVDGLTLKPTLRHILKFRFRAVRDQLGYKLPALLESRARLATSEMETCFGDDAEMDALVYRLYGDLCGGRLDASALEQIMSAARLYEDQAERIRNAAALVGDGDPVERICIHLETRSPTGRFDALGPRVATTFNTFQTVLVLFRDGHLSQDAAGSVVDRMRVEFGYDSARLQRSLEDALRRRLVELPAVIDLIQTVGLDSSSSNRRPSEPKEELPVDYVSLLQELHEYHRARKRARRSRTSLRDVLEIDRD